MLEFSAVSHITAWFEKLPKECFGSCTLQPGFPKSLSTPAEMADSELLNIIIKMHFCTLSDRTWWLFRRPPTLQSRKEELQQKRWKELAGTNVQFSVGNLRNTQTFLLAGKHRLKSTVRGTVVPFCPPLLITSEQNLPQVESQVRAWCWQEVGENLYPWPIRDKSPSKPALDIWPYSVFPFL